MRSLEYLDNENELKSDKLQSDNKNSDLYKYKIKDIIYNPKYHFYFRGIKVCLIDIVKEMKTNN